MAESTPTTSNSEDGQIHGYNNSDVSYRIASSKGDFSPLPITFLLYIHTYVSLLYGTRLFTPLLLHTLAKAGLMALSLACDANIPTILLLPKQTKLELNKGQTNIIPTLMLKALYQI